MPLDDTSWNKTNSTTSFTIEALNQLKRVLHEVEESPLKKLNMWNFGTGEEHCSTAACSLGWAARDPWFINHGLRLKYYHNFKVAAEFFQITCEQAVYVFRPAFRWSSVPHAIKRIDKILKEVDSIKLAGRAA